MRGIGWMWWAVEEDKRPWDVWALNVVIRPAWGMNSGVEFQLGTLILCVCVSRTAAELRICTWKSNKGLPFEMAHKQNVN